MDLNKERYSSRIERNLRLLLEKEGDEKVIKSSLWRRNLSLFQISFYNHENDESLENLNSALLAVIYSMKEFGEGWVNISHMSTLSLASHETAVKMFFNTVTTDLFRDQDGNEAFRLLLKQVYLNDIEGLKQTFLYLKSIDNKLNEYLKLDYLEPLALSFIDEDKSALLYALAEMGKYKDLFEKIFIPEKYGDFLKGAFAKCGLRKNLIIESDLSRLPLDDNLITLLKDRNDEPPIPYGFLRDFYREQGIDWRYDPVYPELQGWNDDPENPNKKTGGFFKNLKNMFK